MSSSHERVGVSFPVHRKEDKWARDKKSPTFSFELDKTPSSATEIGRTLKERLAEIDIRNEYPEKHIVLSGEAEFVEELDSAIKDFNRTHTEFEGNKLDMRAIASLLTHEEAHGYYSREYLRALMSFIQEQYEVSATKDFMLLPDEEGDVPEHVVIDGKEETARTARTRARAKISKGLASSWKHLYSAIVRQEHEASREGRVQENAHALFTEADEERFNARLEEYLKNLHKFPRHQVRKIHRALIKEAIGPTLKNGVHSPNVYAQKMQPLGARIQRDMGDPHKTLLKEAVEFVALDAENVLDMDRTIRLIDAPPREIILRYYELYEDQVERAKETGEEWDNSNFEQMEESLEMYEDAIVTELASLGREAREEYHTFPESDPEYIAKLWSTFVYGQRMVFLEAVKEDLLSSKIKLGSKDAPVFQKLYSIYQKCTAIISNGNEIEKDVLVSLQELMVERKKEMQSMPEEDRSLPKERVAFERTADLEQLALTFDTERIARIMLRESAENQKGVFAKIEGTIGFGQIRNKVPGILGRTLSSVDQGDLAELVSSKGTAGNLNGWRILFETYKKKLSR